MNRMKKLASMLLALVMVLAMAAPAMAAMEGTLTGGSITINDAVPGNIYNAYQILYLESYNATSNAYAYRANSAWAEWLNTQTAYVTIDSQGYVTWVKDANVADFAKAAQGQLENKAADATATAPAAAEGATYSSVTLSNLNLGYYLVDTTLGTLCSLDTTNPSVVMQEKNEVPTVTKEVKEDSNGNWGDTNDADIGQTVEFRATITVQSGAVNYVLHDEMSAGLTYDGVTSVVIGDTEVEKENYTVKTSVSDSCDFEVVFKNEYIATLTAGTQIVVYYSAVVNENAVVGLDGNLNKVMLSYGEKSTPDSTPWDETITYTWDMDVVKYTKNGETEVRLSGATFKLSTDTAGENVIKFHSLGENKYEVCAETTCTEAHVTEITTDETGTFNIEGLDAGTYYLTETAAPDGYNKLATSITVIITGATKNEDTGELEYKTVEQKVENNSGTELPSTGGAGTTVIYVVGGVLVLAAIVLLITRKRMGAEK